MASYLDKTGLQYFWDQIKTKFATNAFSKVRVTVNSTNTDISADSTGDMLTIIAGDNITLTPNASTDTLTIAAATGAQASDDTPVMDGTGAAGSSVKYSRGDHVHPKDTSKANLASPTFTGTPKAPTATAGTNTTQIATTAFVQTALTNAENVFVAVTSTTAYADVAAAVTSGKAVFVIDTLNSDHTIIPYSAFATENNSYVFSGMIGDVRRSVWVLPNSTWNSNSTTLAALASPAFTGTPTAPTATAGTNTTQVATTAFVKTAIDNAVTSVYRYKGSVATAASLPSTGQVTGDVYNIEAESTYGPAGTNVAWTGSVWDALGGLFTITSITTAEIDAIVAA